MQLLNNLLNILWNEETILFIRKLLRKYVCMYIIVQK